jgi:hypothetical protein
MRKLRHGSFFDDRRTSKREVIIKKIYQVFHDKMFISKKKYILNCHKKFKIRSFIFFIFWMLLLKLYLISFFVKLTKGSNNQYLMSQHEMHSSMAKS